MHNIYWLYEGYSGDKFGSAESLTERFAIGSKSTLVRCFSWLNQKGFGLGYFNNSGVYFLFQRSTFKSPEAASVAVGLMKAHYACKIFDTEAEYKLAITRKRDGQKDMRKRNPF